MPQSSRIGMALFKRLSFLYEFNYFQVSEFTFIPSKDAATFIAYKLDIYNPRSVFFSERHHLLEVMFFKIESNYKRN